VNQILEVIITKKKINFIATCPLFPNCNGIGKTRKEALRKLANAISSCISKMINTSLSNVLTSDNYTQLMFDHTNDEKNEQIAFNLNLNKINVPRSFLLKVASFSSEDEEYTDSSENIFANADFESVENELVSGLHQDEDASEFTLNPHVANDSDAFVFGFPLNFN
tara:strand:+ start:364 stop:861 length:498 start_codon:yes stop_codon:yes gene_type:complete